MSSRQKDKRGFTIIEVVLVLAIAGLILLMVLIALPALQRTQRDTQRRNDLSRAQTQLQNYQTNNRNSLPGTSDSAWNQNFRDRYLTVGGDTFMDPSTGETYIFRYRTTRDLPTVPVSENSEIWVYGSSTCDGESIVASGGRRVAMAAKLEGGGVSCVSN